MYKRRYNNIYFNIKFIVNNYVYIRFFVDYIIFNFIIYKLNQQRINLFKIFKKNRHFNVSIKVIVDNTHLFNYFYNSIKI